MTNELNQGLEELLSFADDPHREETGQLNTDLDDKSFNQDDPFAPAGKATEEGTQQTEAQTSEEGTEDGGEESEEVSAEEEASVETASVTQLRAELATIKELLQAVQKTKEGQQPEAVSQNVELPSLKPVIADVELFQGYEFEEMMENPDTFKKWAKQLVSKVQEVTQEAIYKNIPQVIQSYTDQQIAVNSQAQKFYQDNPDLSEHKTEVAKNANLIAQADPGLSQDDFFKKVASFTRMNLNLTVNPDPQEAVSEKPKPKPALNKRSAKAGARMTSQPELAGIEREISDMLDKLDT